MAATAHAMMHPDLSPLPTNTRFEHSILFWNLCNRTRPPGIVRLFSKKMAPIAGVPDGVPFAPTHVWLVRRMVASAFPNAGQHRLMRYIHFGNLLKLHPTQKTKRSDIVSMWAYMFPSQHDPQPGQCNKQIEFCKRAGDVTRYPQQKTTTTHTNGET